MSLRRNESGSHFGSFRRDTFASLSSPQPFHFSFSRRSLVFFYLSILIFQSCATCQDISTLPFYLLRTQHSNHERSYVLPSSPHFLTTQNANRRASVRFLDLIKPFTPLLPEVASPESKIPFNQKLMWTGVRNTMLHAQGCQHETDIWRSVHF